MRPRRGPLPHERDEAPATREAKAPPQRRERIKRAAADAESGRQDTERRGVPSDVPSRRTPK